MKKAWQNPIGTIRDVCESDPALSYHPDIAKLYTTDVPDSTVNGATLVSGAWVNPAPPPAPVPPTAAEIAAAQAADLEAKRLASVPAEISPRQIRQALTATGLRASVETAVAAADQDTKDWWEFATTFERSHSRVIGMAQALGVTPRQMDDLWTLGGSL